MLDLEPIIARIRGLLAQDTDASVTYAALEARLALEKVAYDRLRQRHDYISHAQLKRWQPGRILRDLLARVDDATTATVTLRISENGADWHEVGTEVGFDAEKLAKMWQALASLALHIRLPESSSTPVSDYGDKNKIATKVSEVLQELESLSASTTATSGFPKRGVVSFVCVCGETNKRRRELLKQHQQVYCINPDCREVWDVKLEDGQHSFKRAGINVNCVGCGCKILVPWRSALELARDEMLRFHCNECSETNEVWWQLAHGTMRPPTNSD